MGGLTINRYTQGIAFGHPILYSMGQDKCRYIITGVICSFISIRFYNGK